jgi:hypothetical protein
MMADDNCGRQASISMRRRVFSKKLENTDFLVEPSGMCRR